MKQLLIVLVLSAAGWAQNAAVPVNPPTEAGFATTSLCVAADAEVAHQCLLRETARLFILAGQREAALRILCVTQPAQEAFRPGSPLDDAKWPQNVEAIRRCLQASGLSSEAEMSSPPKK